MREGACQCLVLLRLEDQPVQSLVTVVLPDELDEVLYFWRGNSNAGCVYLPEVVFIEEDIDLIDD